VKKANNEVNYTYADRRERRENMRLSKDQIDVIKKSVRARFGFSSKVFLFGSRLYDAKSGGDIDLLIEHDGSMEGGSLIKAKLKTMTDIQFALGDRKIDIVTVRRRTKGSQKEDETEQRAPLIVQEARKEAVEL